LQHLTVWQETTKQKQLSLTGWRTNETQERKDLVSFTFVVTKKLLHTMGQFFKL
jgi:hypothetical protein